MKERPILFSGAMVRALLDGSKTQTRRMLKPQPDFSIIKAEYQDPSLWEFRKRFMMYADDWSGHEHAMYRKTERGDPDLPVYQHRSPFGEPGDRLWVRETFFAYGGWETRFNAKKGRDEWHFVDMTRECDRVYQYAADHPDLPIATSRHDGVTPAWWKRPAIHMPRHVSRTDLNMTGVRIERLNDCSQEDAEAEGIRFLRDVPDADETLTPRQLFMCLWDSINEDRGLGWDINPWVWVVEFKRVTL